VNTEKLRLRVVVILHGIKRTQRLPRAAEPQIAVVLLDPVLLLGLMGSEHREVEGSVLL
jgi:hypothetical protein